MDYLFLSSLPLFQGYNESQVEQLLNILPIRTKRYQRDEMILHAGDVTTELGLVLSGSVQIENMDLMGNRSILGLPEKGDVFAESYACIPGQPLLVDVVAAESCEILFLNVGSVLREEKNDELVTRFLKNLIRISSKKNQVLSMRIFHAAPKTIRARLMSFFAEQVTAQGSMDITIAMDRQQLADYLGVERTALSKELGKMRDEGLLIYKKNHFQLMVECE